MEMFSPMRQAEGPLDVFQMAQGADYALSTIDNVTKFVFMAENRESRQLKRSSDRFDSRLCAHAIHFVASRRLAFALAK